MNLFELSENWIKLREMLMDESIDQEAINDTLESIEGAVEEKADNYAYIIAEIDAQTEMLKKEADRLNTKRASLLNNKERLRGTLLSAMQITGKVKFKTDRHSFYIMHNSSVEITDEALIPQQFKKYEVKIDKAELKKAMQDDIGIEGAELKESESVCIK